MGYNQYCLYPWSSLQAGPYTQALFLPSVTFCSKLCPLLKSLRTTVLKKFSLSPKWLLSAPYSDSSTSHTQCLWKSLLLPLLSSCPGKGWSPSCAQGVRLTQPSHLQEREQISWDCTGQTHSLSQSMITRLLSWEINGKSWLLLSNNCWKSAVHQTAFRGLFRR